MTYSKHMLYKPRFLKEWEEYSLADLAEWINGRAFRKDDYSEGGWPVIKIAELNSGIGGSTQYSDKQDIPDKYSLSKGDLLFSWSGNPKTSIDSFLFRHKNGWLNQHIYKVLESEAIRKDYLYYLLKYLNPNFEIIASNKQTTGLGHITKSDLGKIFVRVPLLLEQKTIASTLSALDDKIELNNKINDNLEAQTQALFKHWFVDFEFPDENGNPYKSSGGVMVESELGMIPDGWEVVKLIDIADRKNGYSYRSVDLSDDANNKMLTLKNFNRDGTYDYKSYRRINITDRIREHHFVEDDDILLACTDLTQKGEVVGNPVLYFEIDNFLKAVFSMDLVKIVPKDIIYKYFIYYSFKNRQFKEYAKNNSTGTTVLHFKKKSIDEFSLLKPNEKLANEFSKFGRAINDFIIKNAKENRKLAQLRDTLLPKLMSGKIRIPPEQ